MNTIDSTQLGTIGAHAAYQILEGDCLKMAVSKNSTHWTSDEPARTSYAQAVVRAYLKQVGEGFPSVEECKNVYITATYPEEGVLFVRNLMLSAFAKKMEEGTGAWAAVAAEELTASKQKIANLTFKLHEEMKLHLATKGKIEAIANLIGHAAWQGDEPMRTAFAGAVREQVEKECSNITAEEVSRAEFEKEWNAYCTGDDFTVDEKAAAWHMWQAARASTAQARRQQ